MRKFYNLLVLFALFMMIVACRDESSTLGGKWLESKFRNVVVDTCTVRMSTLILDSVNTSSLKTAFIGKYEDTEWGSIISSSYMEYEYQAFTPEDNLIYRFDSVTLRMCTNGEYLGDTLQPCRIRVHRLKEGIELDNGYLYNVSSFSYEEPFTTVAMRVYPRSKSVVEARLPDEFGLEWFNAMLEQSTIFDSQDNFCNYFHGLAFTPEDGENIMGFSVADSSFCIRLYYHEIGESSREKTVSLTPSETKHFVRTEYNHAHTLLSSVMPGRAGALSDNTGNKIYLQGMTGLYAKLEFPFLNNLLQEGEVVTVESAKIYFYPVKGSYGGYVPLPDSLSLYTVDENNTTYEQVTDVLGSSVQNGDLTIDELLHQDTYYSFDITSFMQSNLGAIGINRKYLQLSIPDSKMNTSFQSVLLGDMNHQESPVKLELQIKIYNK